MPRKWSGKKPNPSLRERGIDNHLRELGIDVKLFKRFVAADVNPFNVRKFFTKPDGSMYSLSTVSSWIQLIKEQQPQQRPDQSQDDWADEQMRQAPED